MQCCSHEQPAEAQRTINPMQNAARNARNLLKLKRSSGSDQLRSEYCEASIPGRPTISITYRLSITPGQRGAFGWQDGLWNICSISDHVVLENSGLTMVNKSMPQSAADILYSTSISISWVLAFWLLEVKVSGRYLGRQLQNRYHRRLLYLCPGGFGVMYSEYAV